MFLIYDAGKTPTYFTANIPCYSCLCVSRLVTVISNSSDYDDNMWELFTCWKSQSNWNSETDGRAPASPGCTWRKRASLLHFTQPQASSVLCSYTDLFNKCLMAGNSEENWLLITKWISSLLFGLHFPKSFQDLSSINLKIIKIIMI